MSIESSPVDREAVAGAVGETMGKLEGIDQEMELKELEAKREEFGKRIARIDERIKKICPEEGAEEQAPEAPQQ